MTEQGEREGDEQVEGTLEPGRRATDEDVVLAPDRRKIERRRSYRFADLTLPEFRRMIITSVLFTIVLVLFLWMVRTVIIAGLLGVVIGVYLMPVHRWLTRRMPSTIAALLTLIAVIVPVVIATIYSIEEITDVATYLSAHQAEVVAQIDQKVRQLPFMANANPTETIQRMVATASNYGTSIPGAVRTAMISFSVAATIFLFTAFYIFTDWENISAWVLRQVPPRYSELSASLRTNVRGVLYGAIYSTLLTQLIKSLVVMVMLIIFHVPLVGVLTILSFIIGFFPIVGSWSVYVPVAAWLIIFRDAIVPAVIITVIGFFGNTLFVSMYLRPKIAADKSRVLNFYWMFVGLVCGVYTFGLSGILLGPILIGLLKAVLDTLTARGSWRLLEGDWDADTEEMKGEVGA